MLGEDDPLARLCKLTVT